MKIFKKLMFVFFALIGIILIVGIMVLQKKTFGKKAQGERLLRIQKSPNFKDGVFHNLTETPMMTEDASYFKMLKKFIWKDEGVEPIKNIPSFKRDLKVNPSEKPEITWFGHSSLFIQIQGKNILVDPVFSERPSPVSFVGSKSYPGTRVYSIDDFPSLDYVFITHDHYDHLDYETINQLKEKVQLFFCPLGVGAHLEYWGIEANRIKEFDWWEKETIAPGLELISTPARHFSGRGIGNRNSTLWTSFVLKGLNHSIFIGGDSGYEKHFKEIGEKYGPFDIALLECGQYNKWWANIHMMPEETAQAAVDLKAKVLQPIHWGKFTLALHPWDEPIQRVTKKANELNLKLTTPMIGEKVVLDSVYPNSKWWVM
jgi:L-ascorbate metabolism protein UlaG (beta-lactamase superfamily)